MRGIALTCWPNGHRSKKLQFHNRPVFLEHAKWEVSLNVFGSIWVLSKLRT